jgi:hypothetical protein
VPQPSRARNSSEWTKQERNKEKTKVISLKEKKTEKKRRKIATADATRMSARLIDVALHPRRAAAIPRKTPQDALLAIHILAGRTVQRHHRVFLAKGDKHGDKPALVMMRLWRRPSCQVHRRVRHQVRHQVRQHRNKQATAASATTSAGTAASKPVQ